MCVFCKIIKGDIPSAKIYEDDDVLAILDISQASKGHTLVIPKKHSDSILTIDEESYCKVMKKVRMLAKVITEALGAKGCNILNNCNEVAGQSVMHFHVHIIPRYDANDIKIEFTDHSATADLKKIQEAILKNM